MKKPKHQPPAPQKPFIERFLEASPPEFHDGIRAYASMKLYGLGGMLPAVTKNGRTLALPR